MFTHHTNKQTHTHTLYIHKHPHQKFQQNFLFNKICIALKNIFLLFFFVYSRFFLPLKHSTIPLVWLNSCFYFIYISPLKKIYVLFSTDSFYFLFDFEQVQMWIIKRKIKWLKCCLAIKVEFIFFFKFIFPIIFNAFKYVQFCYAFVWLPVSTGAFYFSLLVKIENVFKCVFRLNKLFLSSFPSQHVLRHFDTTHDLTNQ